MNLYNIAITLLFGFLTVSDSDVFVELFEREINIDPHGAPPPNFSIHRHELIPNNQFFPHGVASGSASDSSIVIWTRINDLANTSKDKIQISWEIAADSNFKKIVSQGYGYCYSNQDFTFKQLVVNLKSFTRYYYRFHYNGQHSSVGRTKTLPSITDNIDNINIAIVSCVNYQWGYFAALDRIADRDDIDFVVHLGDYFYEYESGKYPENQIAENRTHYPSNEAKEYQDYIRRFSQYRLDPALQRIHQNHSMFAIWDDHEIANDTWMNGAENHNSGEGNWQDRVDGALKAYFEWMPINENQDFYSKIQIGNLIDLLLLETRVVGRDKPIDSKNAVIKKDYDEAELNRSDRSMLGTKQKEWLKDNLLKSKANWKLVGSSVMMMPIYGFKNMDAWDGYPAERKEILDFVYYNNIKNFGVLSGDMHISFGAKLPLLDLGQDKIKEDNKYVGFEFTTPSVSSANFNELIGQEPNSLTKQTTEKFFRNINPHFKLLEMDNHGYVIVKVDKDRIEAQWWHLENVLDPNSKEFLFGTMKVSSK